MNDIPADEPTPTASTEPAWKKPTTGEQFEVNVTPTYQDRLDGDAVKAFIADLLVKGIITPEMLVAAKITKTITFFVLRSTRVAGTITKFEVPNLSNATPKFLADELGKVREEKKKLVKLEGIYKEALKSRIGVPLEVGADEELSEWTND